MGGGEEEEEEEEEKHAKEEGGPICLFWGVRRVDLEGLPPPVSNGVIYGSLLTGCLIKIRTN